MTSACRSHFNSKGIRAVVCMKMSLTCWFKGVDSSNAAVAAANTVISYPTACNVFKDLFFLRLQKLIEFFANPNFLRS